MKLVDKIVSLLDSRGCIALRSRYGSAEAAVTGLKSGEICFNKDEHGEIFFSKTSPTDAKMKCPNCDSAAG
jgi:hypothetical protein